MRPANYLNQEQELNLDMSLATEEPVDFGMVDDFNAARALGVVYAPLSFHVLFPTPHQQFFANDGVYVSRRDRMPEIIKFLQMLKEMAETSLSTFNYSSLYWPAADRDTSTEYIRRDPADLEEALLDLYSCKTVAEEEDLAPPDSETVKTTEGILRAMYRREPRPYAVYPMPEGEIAIDAHTPPGTKVIVICAADGVARCLTYINGEVSRRDYADPSTFPDDFIKDALQRADALAVL